MLCLHLLFFNDTVFAATMGGGVIMSTDTGASWTSANSGILTFSIYSIILKDNLLFAGTEDNGVFIFSNSGASWTAFNTCLPLFISIRSLDTDGRNIYACSISSTSS